MQRIRFGNAIQYCIADLLIPEDESILRALGPVCNSFQAYGWHFVGASCGIGFQSCLTGLESYPTVPRDPTECQPRA